MPTVFEVMMIEWIWKKHGPKEERQVRRKQVVDVYRSDHGVKIPHERGN
jgi:hypothetical protein